MHAYDTGYLRQRRGNSRATTGAEGPHETGCTSCTLSSTTMRAPVKGGASAAVRAPATRTVSPVTSLAAVRSPPTKGSGSTAPYTSPTTDIRAHGRTIRNVSLGIARREAPSPRHVVAAAQGCKGGERHVSAACDSPDGPAAAREAARAAQKLLEQPASLDRRVPIADDDADEPPWLAEAREELERTPVPDAAVLPVVSAAAITTMEGAAAASAAPRRSGGRQRRGARRRRQNADPALRWPSEEIVVEHVNEHGVVIARHGWSEGVLV